LPGPVSQHVYLNRSLLRWLDYDRKTSLVRFTRTFPYFQSIYFPFPVIPIRLVKMSLHSSNYKVKSFSILQLSETACRRLDSATRVLGQEVICLHHQFVVFFRSVLCFKLRPGLFAELFGQSRVINQCLFLLPNLLHCRDRTATPCCRL